MEEIGLNVEVRSGRGKGPARRLRQDGKIPGVFYGPKSTATPLAVANDEKLDHVGCAATSPASLSLYQISPSMNSPRKSFNRSASTGFASRLPSSFR